LGPQEGSTPVGKCLGLNAVVFRWEKTETALYPACQREDETVYHLLLMCVEYEDLRNEI